MIRVVKRDGRVERLDIRKIQKYTADAVAGLKNVSQSELEVDAKLQFRDMISSEDIQQTMIKTAVDKIDIDRPDWTFVASRLFLYDLYHKVSRFTGYIHLREYFERGEREGRILLGLKEKYDLDKLNSYIRPERDLQFTYLGIKTLYDRYLLKDRENNPIELPQHLFMGVAMFLAQNEEDRELWAKRFYDILSKFEVMSATPTLSNGRTPRSQCSSCFLGSTGDNIEGIFDAYKEMALLSKFGGGIGWDWSQVRGMGSSIDGHKHAAGGIIPFLKITNDVAIAVDQLGCVAKNSFVKVLDSVKTDNFEHNFRREYVKVDFSNQELIEAIASYSSSFGFKYGKFSKNFIRSLIFDYIVNKNGHRFLENIYGLTHDQYKKIIGIYKKINKGLPEGFETVIDYPKYAISKDGIIINIHSLKPLSNIIDRKGYVRVSLGKKSLTLHLLLAKQYLNYKNNDTVDHIDGNKLNNRLDNLQIVSNEKNISKGWENTYKKRTEMLRIRRHLSFGHKLKGERRDTHEFKIREIKTIIVPIDEVRIGDLILSYNIEDNSTEYKAVTSKHEIDVEVKNQIKIAFKDGNYIITSKWHPFPKLINKKIVYIRSDELNIGDFTINEKNELVEIVEISQPKVKKDFFDLTVKDNNNYFCSTDNKSGNFHLIHNTRKGAIAVYIEPWHIDIRDFLDLKKNSGEERRRGHDLFPALWINDIFMERVQNDDIWTLFDPYEVQELTTLYGERFRERYLELERRKDITKEVISAKGLWKDILRSYFETGNPFLTFKDNANRANPNKHTGVIRSSNLCVTGDTRLHTQFGLVKAQDLEENYGEIVATYDHRTDGDLSKYGVNGAKSLKMFKTKTNADIYEVVTKDGYRIKSTLWHEYYIVDGTKIEKRSLKDISIGDKLLIQSGEGQFGVEGNYDLGLSLAKNRDGVPETVFKGSRECVVGYLQGLFSQSENKMELKAQIKFLEDVQIILANFGIYSKLDETLIIDENSRVKFLNEILLIGTDEVSNEKSVDKDFLVEIKEINHIGKEDVYDTTQLYNHSLIFNGIVTGNCTEIFQNTSPNHYKIRITYLDESIDIFEEEELVTLDSGTTKKAKKITALDTLNGKQVWMVDKARYDGETAVCNLASINLSKINSVEDIARVVPTAIRMLDNVIDLNFYPLGKVKKTNEATRAIGLGVMGEAQMLAEKGIKWGSNEHLHKIDEIMESVSYYAIKSSSDLALEKGSYPKFEGSEWSKGIFPIDNANREALGLVQRNYTHNWMELREQVKANGMRNGYLMAIAPTSSISILTGTTQAIEPVYKRKWFEENLSGLIPVVVPNLSPDTWEFYTPSYELNQNLLIRAGAVRQKWIDQGQSLNIFIRLDRASGRYLNEIYMNGWRLGLKSTYYLRSQSPETTNDIEDRSMECAGCQ